MQGITSGSFSEGASTITQQLLKNNVFDGWTSETSAERVQRKIQEQYLAIELEKEVSKDWIMENYLNTINLGQNTSGCAGCFQPLFRQGCFGTDAFGMCGARCNYSESVPV